MSVPPEFTPNPEEGRDGAAGASGHGTPGYGYGTPQAGRGQSAPGYGPPPQYYGQQPPYGQPGPYAYPPRTSGRATAVLVLGIVSLGLTCTYGIGIIAAIVALCLAPGANAEIRDARGALTGDGMVKAGVICSWVTVGLVVAGILLFAALIALSASTSF